MEKLVHVGLPALLLLPGLCSASGDGPAAKTENGSKPGDYSCGTHCLYVLAALEGRRPALSYLAQHLDNRLGSDLSMFDLRRVAAAHGLRLEGVRIDPSRFPLDRPAIALLRRKAANHYVVIRPLPGNPGMVQVLDPPESFYTTDVSLLCSSSEWTGLALVPEREVWSASATAAILAIAAALFGIVFLPRIPRALANKRGNKRGPR